MSMGRDEQAEKEYEIILGKDEPSLSDYVNAGYCYWFRGNIHKAATLFRKYYDNKGISDLYVEFRKDEQLLQSHGIGSKELNMMCELVQWDPEAEA